MRFILLGAVIALAGCASLSKEVDKHCLKYGEIYFDPYEGATTVQTRSYESLVRLLEHLREYPEADVHISGHADREEVTHHGEVVASHRARLVRDFLRVGGIKKKRIKTGSNDLNGDPSVPQSHGVIVSVFYNTRECDRVDL